MRLSFFVSYEVIHVARKNKYPPSTGSRSRLYSIRRLLAKALFELCQFDLYRILLYEFIRINVATPIARMVDLYEWLVGWPPADKPSIEAVWPNT